MIRYADKTDTADIISLWQLCFPDASGFNEFFFEKLFQPENTLLFCDNGIICAMAQMIPYKLAWNNGTGVATYIYGACTHPNHRRKHLMSQLLKYSFDEDQKKGRIASMLIPAEAWLFDFYKLFGYQPTFYIISGVETAALSQHDSLAERLSMRDMLLIDHLYREQTQNFLYICRDEEEWKRQFQLSNSLGAGVWGIRCKDRLAAYAFVWQDSDGLFAQEIVASSERYRIQLCQALITSFQAPHMRFSTIGFENPLGCLKKYNDTIPDMQGYFNLMLN